MYACHSCRNRHCPKCHRDQTDRWLTVQRARLLPCAYYLLTFTLPDQLRPLARSHQKTRVRAADEKRRRGPPHARTRSAVCERTARLSRRPPYLGRYIFRVAIANSRLERIQDGQVTFRYRDNRTNTFAG